MIIHVWKVYTGLAPNSTGIEFYNHPRHGPKAKIPQLITASQKSIQSTRDASFGVRSLQLYNRMPGNVRTATSIEELKVNLGEFLATIPDLPPVRGYPSPQDNSLVALLTEGK